MHNDNLLTDTNNAIKAAEIGLSKNVIIRYFQTEVSVYKKLSEPCRRLLVSNFLFSLIMRVVQIASAVFIFQLSDGNLLYNMMAFAGNYGGTAVGFFITGLLLSKFKVNKLYAVGIFVNAISFLPLIFIRSSAWQLILVCALLGGIGNGMFWSNKHYMVIRSTTNEDRNYLGGIESLLWTTGQLLAPTLVFLVSIIAAPFTKDKYIISGIIFGLGFILVILATINILRAQFKTNEAVNFLFTKYTNIWNKQRMVNFIEGIAEGALFTLPITAVLFIYTMGLEGDLLVTAKEMARSNLSRIDLLSTLMSTVPIYLLGRYTKPKHRTAILAIGLLSLFVGAAILMLSFNKIGANAFYAFTALALFLNGFIYGIIRLRSIDVASAIEKRNEYAYIFDSELFTALGRVFTIGLFCVLYSGIINLSGYDKILQPKAFNIGNQQIALKYILFIAAILQLAVLPLVKKMKQSDIA